jgi:4-amino-4-deoxy-L-arabinose transferase-like glycosyltransferase
MNSPTQAGDPAASGDRLRSVQWLGLLSIVGLAFALRLFNLSANGWGADYYSAAIQSMSQSWHNFFYASFDRLGFISVDKPPVALWLQVLSVKLLGFTPFALQLPQVLEGVTCVLILFHLVRRTFGVPAALLAALLLATTPVWVAVNRTNNVDSCLLLVQLLAGWALLLAAERSSRRHLLLAMLGVGIAFNVKMMAAYLILPGFFATYLLAARAPLGRRAADACLALLALAAVSLVWILCVELTPADERPYVGSSHENSMIELIVGHNALDRFVLPRAPANTGQPGNSAVAPATTPTITTEMRESAVPTNDYSSVRAIVRRLVLRLFVTAPPGVTRLIEPHLAAQASWFLPLAVFGVLLVWRSEEGFDDERASRARRIALGFWGWWLVVPWIVYSTLGGIVHYYYLATLAPPLCVLAALGIVGSLARLRARGAIRWLLPVALTLTAVWQLYVDSRAMGMSWDSFLAAGQSWIATIHWIVVVALVVAVAALSLAVLLSAAHPERRLARLPRAIGLGIAVAGLSVLPLIWALASVLLPGEGILPSADLYRLAVVTHAPRAFFALRLGKEPDTSRLLQFLRLNRGDAKFLLATSTTHLAAPLILASGEPVMARGGYHGLDAAVDPKRMAELVQTGALRYAMLDDVPDVSRLLGADAAGQPVADWIRQHGQAVDVELWGPLRLPGGVEPELYDLRPELGTRRIE